MGGMIVQTMAIEHRDRLATMTSVMSSTGDADVGQSSEEARKLILGRSAQRPRELRRTHLDGIRTWGSPAYYDKERSRVFAEAAFDRCFCPEGQARQAMAISGASSRTAALHDVTIPALVVHGTADRLVDPSGGRRTAEAIPGARFVLIDGMGHDYPPQLWDELVQLIADHARSSDQ